MSLTGPNIRRWRLRPTLIGSFSNDDRNGNENVEKVIGLISKTTTLHVQHPFFVHFFAITHYYDVKMPTQWTVIGQ